jgi:hypothetical protein
MSGPEISHDAWLHALRRDPSTAFKEQLHARLRAQDPPADTRLAWPRRALIAAAATVVAAVLLSVPGVRASVAQFVSLFRVAHFVAVPVDSSRLDRLEAEHLEIGALIGEHVDVLQDPGPPLNVASLADAAAAAGMTLALPQWLPDNSQVLETTVIGERVVRVTANSQRLQQVMDALGINDLAVPAGLDGHMVDIRVPPVVTIRYDHSGRRSRLVQARSPQLALPDSIDIQTLGEIGLRVLGLGPAEAKQFAGTIDWHSTLIVPVPPNAASFRQVSIAGQHGVVIQHHPRNGSLTHTVVWSTPERVFVLLSTQAWDQVLAMAVSVR